MIDEAVKKNAIIWFNQKSEELEKSLPRLEEKLKNCEPENGRDEFIAIGEQYINVKKQLQAIRASLNDAKQL
jgi:hypothetical protein